MDHSPTRGAATGVELRAGAMEQGNETGAVLLNTLRAGHSQTGGKWGSKPRCNQMGHSGSRDVAARKEPRTEAVERGGEVAS